MLIVLYIAPGRALCVDRLMPCLSCRASRAVTLSCADRVNRKGHDKTIPSKWIRCELICNRLYHVSRVRRVMLIWKAVSASVVLCMNIDSPCPGWICVSFINCFVCYGGLPVRLRSGRKPMRNGNQARDRSPCALVLSEWASTNPLSGSWSIAACR